MNESREQRLVSALRAILYNKQVEWLRQHGVDMTRFDGVSDDLLERSYNHEIADVALDWEARQRRIQLWKDMGLFNERDEK